MSVQSPALNFFPISSTTNSLGPNDPELGMQRLYGGEEYRFAYNAGNSQASMNYLVINSASTSGFSFTVSSVTETGRVFGIIKHATIATAYYGWVLVRGVVDVVNGMASTTPAAQGQVAIAVDGKFAAKTYTAADIPFGTVMSAGASGGTGASMSLIYVRCL